MSINRRKFLKLSSVTMAGVPLSRLTKNAPWYDLMNDNASPAGDLYTAFKDPVNTSKPFVRWWWNGLRVVKEELVRELDMLKQIGIGGVEINSIRFPDTADQLNYQEYEWLSPQWIDLLEFAVKAAKERGMICDIIMGSGWPFGGEFLTREEQTQLMSLGTLDVLGPKILTLTKADLEKAVDPPVSFKNPDSYKELFALRLAPAKLENLDSVVNLDAEVGKDTITVNIPAGDYVLYSLVNITGYMSVIYGAPGAQGPVLNHYNKEAVQKYVNRMSDALTPKIGKLGNSFRSVFCDSMELQGANWYSGMAAQFKQRRGYDIIPYLPFILYKTGGQGRHINAKYGAAIGNELLAKLDRIRYDFELTKMELFKEHFLDVFLKWCRDNGVKSRVQAYGREFFPLDSSMDVDIPECETWLRSYTGQELKDFDYRSGRTYSPINKFVASGAHLSGKKIVSCEEITNTEVVFNDTLERIKQTGDQSNLSGVTHSILHGFNYSPKDAAFPGWIRYGTYFNERNPWWPYLHEWVGYKARLSAVFQNGTPMADVAVMHPLADLWSKYTAPWDPFPELAYPAYVHNIWEAIHQNGSGCDYVTEKIIQGATFPGGRFTYGPRQYKVLMVVEAETIQPATAEALKKYADAGGTLIFIEKYPHQAPGYHDHEKRDRQVDEVIQTIRNKKNVVLHPAPTPQGRIIDWYKELQDKLKLAPYIRIDQPQVMVSQVYYKYNDADAFFISNYSDKDRFEFTGDFNIGTGKTAWLWNPETGERYLYPINGAKNKLHISLGPAETKLIIFDHHTTGKSYMPLVPPTLAKIALDAPWSLTLNHINGSKKTIGFNKFVDFKEDTTLVSFAGTAIYETRFNVKDPNGINVLSLGKVHDVSEVTLNEKNLGNRWYGDHIYSVKGALKPGENTLSIKLTTTIGNYMASLTDDKNSIKWIKNKKQPLYSHGIMGPVVLG